MPARGLLAFIGYGQESVNGTPVVADHFIRIMGESLRSVKEPFLDEQFDEDHYEQVHFAHERVEGDTILRSNFTGSELFWHALLGTYVFTVDTPEAGVNTHVFTYDPSAAHDFVTGLSIETNRDIAGALKDYVYAGLHPMKVVLELDPSNFLKETWSFIGRSEAQVTPAAATFPSRLPITAKQAGTVSIGSTDVKLLGGSIEFEVPKQDDRAHYGQSTIAEALRNNRPNVTAELTVEYADDGSPSAKALYEKYRDEEILTSPLSIIWTGGTIPTKATAYSLNITSANAYVLGETPVAQNKGIIQQTLRMRFVNPSAFTATFVNDTAQAT